MQGCLADKEQMLDVMPELDHQRHCPPCSCGSAEPLAEYPKPDQHHQSVAVVKRFRLDQPRVPKAQNAVSLRAWPAHHKNLIGLHEVFTPVSKHDKHEDLQRTLMPHGVQLLVEAGTRSRLESNVLQTRVRNRHQTFPSIERARLTTIHGRFTQAGIQVNNSFILGTKTGQ